MESEEIEILEAEILRRKTLEPLRTFKPNSGQERFISAITDDKNRIIVFSAANWIGKTASAIACLGAMIWPEQAEDKCFNNPIFKQWESFGYCKRARIVSTPKELELIGSIQTEIQKWWPAGRYKGDKIGKTYPSQFSTDTGWMIDLLTYDMAMEQFEGANIGVLIFNEPPRQDIFDASLARMKMGGKVLMPLTPLTDSAWIYDRLVAFDGTKGIKVVYGSTEENCREHSKNGVIPHQAIVDLENSLDPDDVAARLHGKFSHLAGQIFKSFCRDIHVSEFQLPEGCNHYQVVDPAIGKPLACLWGAVDKTGKLYIYDEWPEFEFEGAKDSGLTVKDYAELFKIREEGKSINRILDRHFGNVRRTCGGLTLRQEFAECGMDYMDSYSVGSDEPEVETGILKIKDYLRYNKEKPIDNLNQPKIIIDPKCKNVIHSLERWGRNEKTGKPKEEYKDFADCLRYLVMANPCVDIQRDWNVKQPYYGVNIGNNN